MSQKQAKRRRRDQKAREQQEALSPDRNLQEEEQRDETRDLEELLRTGDIDGYAQACWNLASRTEEPPRIGEVITLSGPCDTHDFHEYRFRLTMQSMMTIAQCTGVETCGEAIRLVAKKLPPETLPCYPHGHGEQFQDFIMYGIEPYECVYCGETPEFTHQFKSINWPSAIPIKGVDGQGYNACPNCASDMLDLQGEKLGQWGWKISCMDCGWEIKQAELLDIQQYCDLMEQTKRDLNSAINLMGTTSVDIETRVRTVGVQTRMILENIAFAALVSNKDTSGKSPEEMKKLWNPREIFKDIEKVHPEFFPKPVKISRPHSGRDNPLALRTEGVLNREKLLQAYRELNALAHSRNPLDEPIDYKYFMEKIPTWLDEIFNTLETHQVMLYHHPDHFYIVKMEGDKDGSVQCTPFTKDATGTARCAWPDCVSQSSRGYCEFWARPWSECALPEKEPAQTAGKLFGAEIDRQQAEERAQELIAKTWDRRRTSRG